MCGYENDLDYGEVDLFHALKYNQAMGILMRILMGILMEMMYVWL